MTKIRRRTEVIRECLETVPDDIDAARELLKYGLRATDLEALIALNKGDDGMLVLAESENEKKSSNMQLISQVDEKIIKRIDCKKIVDIMFR